MGNECAIKKRQAARCFSIYIIKIHFLLSVHKTYAIWSFYVLGYVNKNMAIIVDNFLMPIYFRFISNISVLYMS